MSIAITTPTGNIGSRALEQLLQAGAEVSVIARQPEKLPAPVRRAVEIYEGSVGDVELLKKAFRGAQAVLWVTPNDITHADPAAYYEEMGASAAAAIRESRVPYVVNISSAGAQLEAAGPVSRLGRIERLLEAAAENIVHLRPSFFMENFLQQIEPIKSQGAIYDLLPAQLPMPLVATRDIGDVAAELLLETNWSGHRIRGLHGPSDLAFAEAARIIGDSIGKPVTYVQITPDQARQTLLAVGASAGFAEAYIEMYQALSQPGAIAEARTQETTTPTTLREWSDAVLRPLFAG